MPTFMPLRVYGRRFGAADCDIRHWERQGLLIVLDGVVEAEESDALLLDRFGIVPHDPARVSDDDECDDPAED